jgi:phospholipid/cholesterol/gamma-HCH transport system substrate-binding protein
MTVARGAALAALAIAIVAVAFLVFGGDGSTKYKLRLETATLLVKDNDVQIGGRRVGSIRDIKLTDENQAEITIELSNDFAPLHKGTTAIVRATSLSGIANRYIALTPGPQSNPKIPDGGTITADKTTSPVSLDQLFNTLDPKTRKSLQEVIQGSAEWYQGRGEEAQRGAKYFSPALSSTTRLVDQLSQDQKAFADFVVNSSRLVTALADRRDDLANLVTNASNTAGAIASENAALDQALSLLPGTLRRANTTFVNLRATLDDLDVLVAESKPATKDLAKFFRELRPLVHDARPTIRDLASLIKRSGSNNDLIDLLNAQPKLESVAQPSFSSSIQALKKSQSVVDFFRPYTPDFTGWLRDFGQGASNYDANGHFARVQPLFNAFAFDDNPAGGTLTPLTPAQRTAGLQYGVKRCPGAASQAPADGSAPFLDDGNLNGQCDPSLVPPGP